MTRTGSHRRMSTRVQACTSAKDIVEAARLAARVPQQIRDARRAKAQAQVLFRLWDVWLPTLREDTSHGLKVPEQGEVPSDELLVAFASHYAHHARGVQNKEIRTVTLVKHMRNFMNLLEEIWDIAIRKDACHGPLTEMHHLHTEPSERPIADLETVDALISIIWSEEFMPQYQRDRIQYHALLLLFLFTAARAGTILESGIHLGSDEGLSYCDVNLRIYPSPHDEEDIFLRGQLVLRYSKGNRGSAGRDFRYDISDSEHLSENLCRLLLLIGFLDDAWQDFESLDDLIRLPGYIPAKGIPLRVKDSMRLKPVFTLDSETHQRGESTVTRLAWRDAWPRLREFGARAGLKDNFTLGTIRRLCANAINFSSFTDAQRGAAMAHGDKRSVYASNYAAPQFNFQRVIESLREGKIEVPFRTMSQNMDARAPRRPEHATLLNKLNGDGQFMQNFRRRVALKDAITTRRGSLRAGMNSAAGLACLKLQRGALAQIREVRTGLTKKARKEFFENTTRRLLRSRKVAPKPPRTMEPVLPVVQVLLPGMKLLNSMRGIVLTEEHGQSLDTLKLLYSFCNLRTRLEAFLPGEEIVDNRCPQCLKNLEKLKPLHKRTHVHRCVTRFRRCQTSISMQLIPQTQTLTASVRAAKAIAKSGVCTLEACGHHKRRQASKFRSKEAAWRHIEEVHSFATDLTPRFPVYCYICLTWIDYWDWTLDHVPQHFQDIFEETSRGPYQHKMPEFKKTLDGQVFVEKPALVDPLDPAHAFAHDFHLIVRKPGFCPFCVYNTSLPWHRRMHQFSLLSLFRDHLVRHILMLDASKEYGCPDPQCQPNSMYAPHDLGTHLVLVHLLPVYGTVFCSVKLIEHTSLALNATFWVRKLLENFSQSRTRKSSTWDPGEKSQRKKTSKKKSRTESDESSPSESEESSESSSSSEGEEEEEEEMSPRRPRTRSRMALKGGLKRRASKSSVHI